MHRAPAWLTRGEDHLPPGSAWLTEAERGYADRQRFRKRRIEFLIARYTAKTAIARLLGIEPAGAAAGSAAGAAAGAGAADLARIEIRHEPTGAPYLCVDGQRPPLSMSLTDRAGWAVCLLLEGTSRIGCDLELVEPRSAGFVADWFTPAEREYVAATGQPELVANLIWSAKESALKVLGTGLRRDTRSVHVTLGELGAGWQPLTVTTAEGEIFPGWWRRSGAFVLTTAGEQPTAEPTPLDEPDPLATTEPDHGWLADPAG